VATTREIVQRWPEVAVVAHTAYADETYVCEMVAAGARGYVLKGDVPAAVLEALSAARQGKRLRDMVEQLLQASAFVANRSPVLRAEGVMAAEVVAEVVDDWRPAEPDRRVELRLPDAPRSLQGAAEALRMVVGNLVDNAGKHAPPGTPICVRVSQPAGGIRIEVADKGEGWPRSTGWSGAWAAGSGWRATRAAAPGSWSSCPTRPRCRVARGREPPGRRGRPKAMNLAKHLRLLAGLLLAGLLLVACAGPDRDGGGAAQGGATTVPTTLPDDPPATGPARPTGEVTLVGTVTAGVEPDCLLLDAENGGRYLLVGGERAELRPGRRVAVTGRVDRNLLSTCQQGEPLVVASIEPAS
jgi:Protein of unknown function (DUF5818)